jgi:hypothetical protein
MSYDMNRVTPSGGSGLESAAHDSAAANATLGRGFAVGTRVVIRGLQAQPQFNGCAGKIVHGEDDGRWGVELDQGDGIRVSAVGAALI